MLNVYSNKTTVDGRKVADDNEMTVLVCVRFYGHLRRSEVARAVWPQSSPASARIMAQRTVKRMLKKGYLIERPNALGGMSLILAAKGVAKLRDAGLEAQEGYDLTSVTGPQFFHRTVGTRYLIERHSQGHRPYGEYAISKGWAPVGKLELAERFGKIPDGLVTVPGPDRGYAQHIVAADWVEVESSYKPEDELDRIFSVAWQVGSWLNTAETVMLDRVLFVYDIRQRHESMILNSLKRYLREHPVHNPEEILQSIALVRCELDPPLVWRGHEELDTEQAATIPAPSEEPK
jgi:hypothetical protein